MIKTIYNKKIFLLISGLGVIFSLIQIPGDLNFIIEHSLNKDLYLYGRIFLFISFCATFLFAFFSKPIDIKDHHVLILGFLLTVYSTHGQWFLPGYFMAYMQTIISFSLFFPLPKNKFLTFLVISGLSMSFSVFQSPISYADSAALDLKFKIDVIISIFIIKIFSYFAHNFVTLVQNEKEQLTAKFLDIGKNTASIIHDLKGVLFSPTIYIEILEKKLKDNNELLPILGNLRNEFTHISEYVKSLNELSKSHGFESTEINIKNQIDYL